MADKNTAVFGLYPSMVSVEIGVNELKSDGFNNTDISVLFPESAGTRDFAHEKNTKAPEGATTGASTGVILGSALGWLMGIGALSVPGLGPFIAAGPVMTALAGAGVGGTVGGIAGALIGMGIPEYEAKRHHGQDRRNATDAQLLKQANERSEQEAKYESQRHRDEYFPAKVQQRDRDPNRNDEE